MRKKKFVSTIHGERSIGAPAAENSRAFQQKKKRDFQILLTQESYGVLDGRAYRPVGKRIQTGAQSARTSRRADQILQDHVPSDEERDEFADGDVAIHVRGAGRVRYSHSEFRVTRA